MIISQTEEIKAKLDIVDLISEYVQLKQAGANWRACCPFHNEKTPSFMVSREKQIWHCFGCGEGGDAFTFLQKIENVEFPEALRILAQKAGVKLKKQNPQLSNQRTKLLDINRLAAEFFHLALLKSKEGEIARNYIIKRRLEPTLVAEFKLGYAPDSWDKLLNLLTKKGYQLNDIIQAGLAVKNEQGKIYDRFRQRLMFPIFDNNGNIVGFTARILDASRENQGGKYINTPQTLIYNKSQLIYGLDKAKNEIKKKNLAIIVEGNMDVIASHQAKVKNVIASSGTALTLEQLKMLQRYTNNLALAFDADLAGQVAAERGIDTALSLGINISIIQLPKEINDQPIKDPDDCIKQGANYWQEAINKAISIMDFYFLKTFKNFDANDPIQKKEIAIKMLKQIAKLADKVERDHWLKTLAQKLDSTESVLRENLDEQMSNKDIRPSIEIIPAQAVSRENLISEQLVSLLVKYPQNLEYVINHLEPEIIREPNLQQIYKTIILYYNDNKEFNYSKIEKKLLGQDTNLVNLLSTLALLADKDFLDYTEEQIEREIINMLQILKKKYISKKITQLQELISQAEKNQDHKQISELTKDFSELTDQLNNL